MLNHLSLVGFLLYMDLMAKLLAQTRDRLLMLYRSYEQTSTNREDTSLDAFPHAVASLMQR